MDLSALAAYFSLTYIPAPLTIFTHVKKLLPGHYMIINGTNVSTHEYWDISFSEEEKPEAFYIDKIQQLLSDAVSLRLISDVPIGAFLSGGIDSTTIVALMSELSQDPVHTFCMGYGGNTGGFLDEREYAKIVSKKYNTIHEEYEVMPNVNDILDDIVASFDEPFADSSTIPSYYLCKNTREKVTVALSGLGGDELFAGYERYLGFKLSYQFNKLPSFMRKFAGNLILNVPERSDGHYTINHMKRFIRNAHLPGSSRYFGYISNLSEDRFSRLFNYDNRMLEGYLSCKQSIEDRYNNSNASHPLNKVLYTDLKTYLPDDILACTDRISMWHSLEVRVPFLDHKFVELCAQLPIKYKINNFTKKYILKKSFQKQIPEEISKHRKQGFDAPMTNWLRNDLSGLVNNLTNNNIINKLGLFDTNELKNILNEHQDKREIHDKLIWSFIVFNKWYETYMS
jgi:asparagine synthase (glutamine-hydrolysing)